MSEPINPPGPPADVTHLVRQRTEARARRDWATADSPKAEIEAAGWKVTDHGPRTSVSRAAPPSVVLDGEVLYGSAAAVPSRLDEPPDAPWTVTVLASEAPEGVSRLLAALRAHAPAGSQAIVVANDPSERQWASLVAGSPDREHIGGRAVEVLRTAGRLGAAAALNIALRRAAGEFVLLADGSAWPQGDAFGPLAAALADAETAVAGAFGVASTEPGRLRPAALAPTDAPEVGALLAGWIAFRRADYIFLGPLDERFVTPAWLDVWWSLRLRAGADPEWTETEATEAASDASAAGPDTGDAPQAEDPAAAEEPSEFDLPSPRRAVRLDLPLEHEPIVWPPDRSRFSRRNMYRVLDRFGWRDDLV